MSILQYRKNRAAAFDKAVNIYGLKKKRGTGFNAGPPKKKVRYKTPFRGVEPVDES